MKNLYQALQKFSLIWLSCLLLVAIGVEKFSSPPYLQDSPPLLTPLFLLRTAVFLIWSLLFVTAIRKYQIHHSTYEIPKFTNSHLIILGGIEILILVFLGLFLISPKLFSQGALEDGLIENLSAFFCFAASLMFLMAFVKTLKSGQNSSKNLYLFGTIGCAVVLFVIGMEEVSWFQRALEIQTPEGFSANAQKEMNLHNFATSKFEVAYYLGTFALLNLVPLIKNSFKQHSWYSSVSMMLPSFFIFNVAAIITAYNYDMWNRPWFQIAFGITLFGLLFHILDTQDQRTKLAQIGLIVLLISTQVLFLIRGNTLLREWDITEYKELFIPLAFLVYSWEIYSRFVQLPVQKNLIQSSTGHQEY